MLIIGCVTLTLTSCGLAEVDAGEEGVFVMKPVFFGKGGVDPVPLTQGTDYMAFTTDFVKFKVIPIQYNEGFEDIISLDNTPISLTAHALIQINKGETPILLKNFGENWYENDIQKDFCNEVRNEISKYRMMDLTSKRSIYDNISKQIEMVLNKKIYKEKIPIKLLKIIIDKARPTKDVLEEYGRTATAIQALQTQKAQSTMEQARKLTEENRAAADDAYRQKMGLNPDQYIKLRALEIEKEKVDMLRNKANINVNLLMGGEAYPTWQIGK